MTKAATKAATKTNKVNGVDVQKLSETVEAIKQTPALAVFKFRLSNEWVDCGRTRSKVKDFYGTGQEVTTRQKPFTIESDEHQIMLGNDKAPNPVEHLLHALAACVTTSIVYHAAAKGIRVEEVESRLEGDIDLHGFLGLDDSVPRGYRQIRMKLKIKADVPDDQLEELVRLGPTYSPVFDTVTRAVSVEVGLDSDCTG